jgi:hypothetical protein
MPRVPEPGQWVRVKLPDGTPADVTTGRRNGRRIVIVKPVMED